MMDWLKDHSFLATWLSLALAVIVALAKLKGSLPKVDWHETIGLILLLVCFGVAFTPGLDPLTKSYARMMAAFLFGYGVLKIRRN